MFSGSIPLGHFPPGKFSLKRITATWINELWKANTKQNKLKEVNDPQQHHVSLLSMWLLTYSHEKKFSYKLLMSFPLVVKSVPRVTYVVSMSCKVCPTSYLSFQRVVKSFPRVTYVVSTSCQVGPTSYLCRFHELHTIYETETL